jgi:hypothetical protein
VRPHTFRGWLAAAAVSAGLAACSSNDRPPAANTPTATASATATNSGSPSSTPSVIPTAPPTPTTTTAQTLTATATVAPTATATAVASPTASATASQTPTITAASCADPAVHASEPLCALDDATVTCEFLIAAKCLLPYPSSVFLHSDPTTPTGFRLAYERDAMPMNNHGVHVDPSEWNTLDGFSPGPLIEAYFPSGVDLTASGTPPITDLARSLAADSPTVLLDADTGERIVHFVELDAQASAPADQMFLLRPAVRLRDGHHYIVAVRNLVGLDGQPIQPERPFQILRDGLATPVRVINARRPQFEQLFATLGQAGIERATLQLAWDFVTASTAALTGRAVSIRDQGLAANGPGAPPFTVESVEENVSEHILRRVTGHYTVPQFVQSATPPTRLSLDGDGRPVQNGTAPAPFLVNIPRSAVADNVAHPARPIVYGHGLLGTNDEVNTDYLQAMSDRFNFVIGGTNWIGMSAEDAAPFVGILGDVSGFPAVPDRLQQAVLNFILLGRLLSAADGLVTHPAFQLDGRPLIDTQELYYYGNSMGGIEGGYYMALTPDTVRGVLGVGATNYSLLIPRSVYAGLFEGLIDPAYPDQLDRQLVLALIQQLWDRGEPQGYLPHLIADPLPGTPAKKILMQIGLYDAQVPNIGSTVEERSLGMPNLAPTILPLLDVPEQAAPFDGSAFVPYDVDATETPLTNTPPGDDNGVHEAVRRLDAAQRQIDAFLRPDGEIENFCSGPCFFTGVPDVEAR